MKLALIIIAALIVVAIVGLIVLGAIDIPAPSRPIERTIPADRLPH